TTQPLYCCILHYGSTYLRKRPRWLPNFQGFLPSPSWYLHHLEPEIPGHCHRSRQLPAHWNHPRLSFQQYQRSEVDSHGSGRGPWGIGHLGSRPAQVIHLQQRQLLWRFHRRELPGFFHVAGQHAQPYHRDHWCQRFELGLDSYQRCVRDPDRAPERQRRFQPSLDLHAYQLTGQELARKPEIVSCFSTYDDLSVCFANKFEWR
ncbi:hypothetical protein B0H11DRAFT_2286329, partial [Mycena galericulata]